jgi:hypothetical protein
MVPISELANIIQRVFDELEYLNNTSQPNVAYNFNVYANEGEYKKPERNFNDVTKYINCVLSTLGDEKAGISEDTMSVSISTKLDILIPDVADTTDVNGKFNVPFAEYVIDEINKKFAVPKSEPIEADGIYYTAVYTASTVVPGIKEIRPSVGESLSATIYIDWVLVAGGFSSDMVKISVFDSVLNKYVRIYPTRLDIARSSTQESNIKSTDNGASKVATQGTSLVISVIKPNRMDALDSIIARYLIDNTFNNFTVKLEMPINRENTIDNTFDVEIQDAALGAEGLTVPSVTCTLVEHMSIG